MPFTWRMLEQVFRKKSSNEDEFLQQQMPGPQADLPRTLQSVARFAETKQIIDQILQAQRVKHIRSIAILSERPREGRSVFTATLAASLGLLVRQRVLAVDCNTYRGPYSLTLERLLECDELNGGKLNQVRKTLSTNVSLIRLREWAEGLDATAEYEVKSLMDGPGKSFDISLFDTCALAAKNRNNLDPIAIARRCDTAILLISSRGASRSVLNEVRERLKKEKLELLGIAYNEGVSE